MYIIIVGCGKVGYHLTKALLASGHEVLAIERDSRRCEMVCEEMGSVAIGGDGTEATVLSEAGANRCDVLIAVTGFDEDNLVACQMAKWRFNVPRTIALVHNPQNKALLKTMGVDVAVSSTDILLAYVEGGFPAHSLVHVLPLRSSNRELVGIHVPGNAAVVGRSLADLELPPNSLISLVIGKNGQLRPLNGDLHIQADDDVVAITTPDREAALWETLTKTREP